jgi:SAM-dependent methyltransferase
MIAMSAEQAGAGGRLDTASFEDRAPHRYKARTRDNWTAAPCGSTTSAQPPSTPAYFREIEEFRYRTHPWILEAIRRFGVRGSRVLELGFGMGSDHISLAREGANLFGVDLTPRSARITRERFALEGREARVTTADGERLPFADDTFDFVYSFGVIHMSNRTDQVVEEVRRVLRPGGRCWITVYHRDSVFFWWTVFMCDWVMNRGYMREGLQDRLSRIEQPNDNPDMVVRLYRRKQFAALFDRFSKVVPTVEHLTPEDIAYLDERFQRFVPRRLLSLIGRRLGWYVVVEATK